MPTVIPGSSGEAAAAGSAAVWTGVGDGGGVEFGRIAPTIAVSDMERALHFYVDVLGMRKTFENGSPVGFVILKRDVAELHLTLSRSHVGSTSNVAHLLVGDATAVYDHLVAHGTQIVKGLRDKDFGLKAFVFADPDGNRIDVGQKI
jgi:catechol 2,3-dioxygenase-like lactoylglutathione lyase family enzyme